MFAHRRLAICVFALWTGALAPAAGAAVVYQQAVANSNVGSCSPCAFGAWRAFASFTLTEYTVLSGADFAVLDSSWTGRQDLNVSIWDAPFGTSLYSSDFAEENYTRTGSDSTHTAAMVLDGWALAPGTYWLSLLGINGNATSWATGGVGDDRSYSGTAISNGEANYGVTLYGEHPPQVPAPATLSLLLAGLGGIVATRRRKSVA